jgi:hypothetical protein
MVLTKSELIASLQNEVRILVHLAGKVEPHMRDYRPTPKQRSALELLQYLSIMGPELVKATKAGGFNPEAWTAAENAAKTRNWEQTVAVIAGHSDEYAKLLGDWSDADFRGEMDMFGRGKTSKGAFLVNLALCGHAAYRTQLFCYLKSCGREELGTMNLWGGMDAPAPAPAQV